MRHGLTRWSPSSVSAWDPVEEISRMQNRLSEMFGETERGTWMELDTLRPLVDVKEEDNDIVVKTDLPGVNKDDVDINIKGDRIWITANTHRESEEEKEGYSMKERSFKRFARSFSLPANVTEEGAKAKLEDGVLTVTLPKSELEEKQKIMIE
ncbi:Hsp20/alpha crystallin family protein [Methanolobus halotolerans]|uniref:Hsp20/alpha crystallin family protein n=1 Tax=Methanolobus halotolerans TaxID=2052935 RepID=A0A4E0R1D1_9EURY|nr:Hsp20/alpha crystallin family protein [Methanolobus halotolerans]TGC10969.1 Hsp20/alpha crystallin family protein [Methanolobus halotolerans]